MDDRRDAVRPPRADRSGPRGDFDPLQEDRHLPR